MSTAGAALRRHWQRGDSQETGRGQGIGRWVLAMGSLWVG
jgi:hypothetical protein